jgi:hypothetical protein
MSIEVGLQSLKELSAQPIARALGTPFRIAALPRLKGLQVSQFFLCIISMMLLFCSPPRLMFTICPNVIKCPIDREQEWAFRLEMWDDHDTHVEELIALIAHHAVAHAAFAEAVSRRPGKSSSFVRSPECWRIAEVCEDAQLHRRCSHKNMSTFETDEHLQAHRGALGECLPEAALQIRHQGNAG